MCFCVQMLQEPARRMCCCCMQTSGSSTSCSHVSAWPRSYKSLMLPLCKQPSRPPGSSLIRSPPVAPAQHPGMHATICRCIGMLPYHSGALDCQCIGCCNSFASRACLLSSGDGCTYTRAERVRSPQPIARACRVTPCWCTVFCP